MDKDRIEHNEIGVALEIPEHVVFEVLGDEAVLLQLESGTYFSLNSTGTAVWKFVECLGNLESVKVAMSARFDAPTEAIAQDVARLVGRLEEKGLLTVRR